MAKQPAKPQTVGGQSVEELLAQGAQAQIPQPIELPTALPVQQLPQVPQPQPAPISFIEATFTGTYFVSGGQAKGLNQETYEVTVPVPVEWLMRDDFNPMGLFQSKFAGRPKVLGSKPGYAGVATCYLTKTSQLPSGMPADRWLAWQTDREALIQYAAVGRLAIEADLWPSVDDLKVAIKRAASEPEAFKREQAERANGREMVKLRDDNLLAQMGL